MSSSADVDKQIDDCLDWFFKNKGGPEVAMANKDKAKQQLKTLIQEQSQAAELRGRFMQVTEDIKTNERLGGSSPEQSTVTIHLTSQQQQYLAALQTEQEGKDRQTAI